MPFTTTYNPGSVVFLDYPYSTGGKAKRRPALVILDTGDADVIVARITTQSKRSLNDIAIRDWASAGLIAPSISRLDKLLTVEKSMVIRTLGFLSASDHESVRPILVNLFAHW